MAAPFAFERWASIASLIAVISFLPAIDGGASAYKLLTGVGEELDAGGAIIEVGSDRGEGSTSFLSSLANTTGKSFFSIDFSDEGFCNAREVCGGCAYQVSSLPFPPPIFFLGLSSPSECPLPSLRFLKDPPLAICN